MKVAPETIVLLAMCILATWSHANPKISRPKGVNGKLTCGPWSSPSPISWKYEGQSITNGGKYTITEENQELDNTVRSILHINNITVYDEGLYQCEQLNNGMAGLNLTVLPPKPSSNIWINKTVSIGEDINVDCGITLGNVTVTKQCAKLFLRRNSINGMTVKNYTHRPSFNFPVTSKADHEYQCIMYFQSPDPECTTDSDENGPTPFKGPTYKVYHHPDVMMDSNSTSTIIPEGEYVSFTCSYQDYNQMNSNNYAIHWTVADSVTNQVLMAYNEVNVIDNTTTIVLSPTTSVDVRCTVNSTISGGSYVIENTTSTSLTIIPDVTEDNVHVYSRHCDGNNLTIIPNFPPGKSPDYIEQSLVPVQTEQNVIEVALFAVISGIRGNKHIIRIPKSCTRNTSVTVRLNSCSNSEDQQLVRESVSLLLENVTSKCKQQVCPRLDTSDWSITEIQDCVVTIDFDTVPQSLIQAFVSFCTNESDECDSTNPPTSITSIAPSPTITMPPSNPPDPYMPNWMVICVCSFGILLILATTLVICVVWKCLKSVKRRNNRQRNRGDPEAGHVTTLSMETIKDQHLTVPSTGHGSSSLSNKSAPDSNNQTAPTGGETSSQSSSHFTDASSVFTRQSQYTNRSGQSRHSSCQGSRQSPNVSLYSYSSSADRYSRYSGDSRRSCSSSRSSSRAPLRPSPLSQASFKHDPTVGVTTVSLNITINNPDTDLMAKMTQGGQLDIAQPLFRMFNDLGAMEIEKQTRDSGATGFLSSEGPSTFRSERLSNRGGSSGYGGSHQPHFVDNDPNILNPFGKSGFTTNSSDSDDSRHSSSISIPRNDHCEPLYSCSRV